MNTRTAGRSIRLASLGIAAWVVALACGREPTGPGNNGARYAHGLAFQTEFPTAYQEYAASLQLANQTAGDPAAFTQVRIILRFPDGSIAKDTTINFPPGVSELPVPLNIILPASVPSSGVTLSGNLNYLNAAGQTVWTADNIQAPVVPATPGSSPPPPVVVVPVYAGPGATATGVRITPSAQTVNTGGAFSFSAVALDAAGNVMPGTPISFTSSNPALATVNASSGAGIAGNSRGTVNITARLLTGVSAAATLNIVAPPSSIALVSGSGQTADVNAQLANPVVVQVNATDGQPAANVTVTFAAQNGGTVGAATGVTGANGQASTTWRLGGTAGAQTLTATAAGLTGSPVTFNATARALEPVRLAFVQQPPASATAGTPLAPPITVQAVDAAGALVSAFTGPISISLGAGAPTGATLTGTTTVNAVAGVATFNTIALGVPGSYTLVASNAALTSATSTGITITAGAANRLVFQNYPTGVAAGTTIDPITVAVRDAVGNTVTTFTGPVTLTPNGPAASIAHDSASAVADSLAHVIFGAPVTVNAVAGIATFGNLQLTKSGSYTLAASSTGLVSANGPAFTVTAGPASALSVVSGGGQSAAAGAVLPNAIIVKVSDSFGNGIAGVTVNFAPVAGSGSVNPASGVSGTSGTVQTTWTLGPSGGAQTLNASAAGLTPNPLPIGATATGAVAGVPTQIVFTQNPTNATAGVAIAPSVVVSVKDAFNAVVTTYTGNVTLAIGTNPGGSALAGTTTVAAVAGVATFPGISLNKAGVGYTLTAATAAIPAASSAAFNIAAGPATTIVADSGGAQTAAVNTLLPQKLVARVVDGQGNPVAGANVVWNVTGGGGVMSGTTTVTDAAGRVRTGLTLGGTPGANTVTATSGTLVNSPLTFTATATPVATVWDLVADWSYTSPTFHDWTMGFRNGAGVFTPTAAGDSINVSGLFGWSATSAILKNRSGGNVSTLSAQWAPNQVSFHPGPAGNDGATVRWTSPIAGTVLVTATFTGISTEGGQGTTAVLHAVKNGTQTWSDKLLGSVVIPIGPTATRTFSGVTTVAVGDVIDFWSDHNGQYLSDQIGLSITITGTAASAGSATQLVFTLSPSNANAGAAITPAPQVVARDGFGNIANTFTGPVTLAIGTNPGSTAFVGTTTVNATGGLSVFPGLSIPVAGTGYTAVASNTSITSAVSTAFNITGAVATKLVVTQGPAPAANITAGAAIAPTITVTAKDALNNVDAGFTGPVTLSFHINAGGDTAVAGTRTVNAIAGVASFPAVNVRKVGAGYKLLATSGGLAADSTASFNIVADAPFAIVADSGAAPPQSVNAGQVLPLAFVARVIDQFGNPIVGHTVAWNVTGGGGSLSGATTTTDANGRVRATLTTGATPGANTATATATGIGTPASFSASGNVTLANRTWTGGASNTDWSDPLNWSPNGVPVATDSVLVPVAAFMPTLTADAVASRFTLASGATLNLASFNLDAGGNVNVPATGVSGTGKIRMNGAAATVVGVFTNLEVLGGLTTAAGAVTVTGTLSTSGGRYEVGAGITTVGTLQTNGTGAPRMTGGGDLVVNGAANWNASGVYGDSLLTAGTLRIKGTFNMGCNSQVFAAAATHTTSFEGAAAQIISSGCAAGVTPAQEHFGNLVISNSAGVSISGTIATTGQLSITAGSSLSNGNAILLGSAINAAGTYAVNNTTFQGVSAATTSVMPALPYISLTLNNAHNFVVPPTGWSVTNALIVQNGASLEVANGVGTVGSLSVTNGAKVRMTNPAGSLTVNGLAQWNSTAAWGDSLLTAGVIRAKGNWGMACTSAVFNAAGTHTVSFEGTAAQTVNVGCSGGPAATAEHFRHIVVANTSAVVSFPSGTHATGTVTVNAGANLGGSGTLIMRGTPLVNNGTYSIASTIFHGTGGTSTLPAFTIPGLTLDSAHVFQLPATGFAVTNGLTLMNGVTLDVDAGSAVVGSYNMNGASKLRMQHPAGSFTINGTATMNSVGVWGDSLLTAGTLHIKGTWSPGCNSHVFNASGTHTVHFSGAAAQTVNGGCSQGTGASQEHFRNVVVSNTAGAVSFPSTYYATGTVTVNAGATASGGGTWHVDAGALVNTGTYSVTNTTFHGLGSTTTLPGFTIPNLVLDGAHNFELPASGFGVSGTLLIQNSASLSVLGNSAVVGSLNMQSSAKLRMQNPAGAFTVNTTATMNAVGVWGDSLLTAGTLHIKGTWAPGCNSHVFNASGTHTVNFSGAAAQSVNNSCSQGTGASQEHFRNVVVSNTAGAVSFPGTYHATGTVTVNAGATAAGGGLWHVDAGALINNGTYSVTNTTFHGTAGTTTLPGFTLPNLVLDGAHNFELPASGFGVSGTLTTQNGAALDVLGNSSTVGAFNMQSASKLRMQNPAGSFTVNGTATMNSLAVWGDSLLTAGTLHIKGTWSPGCNNYVFNASGTHTVNFSGTAAQTVNGSCSQGTGVAQEHFRNVVVSNTGGAVSFPSTYFATGTVTVNASATASGGGTWHVDAGALVNNGTYSVTNTTFHGLGSTTTLPAFTLPNLTLDGAHNFELPAGGFGVSGTLLMQNGTALDVLANSATVGALNMQSASKLRMQNPAGTFTVNGTATMNSLAVWGDSLLTAGTLHIKGTWSPGCNTHVFNASGTHTVNFSGSAAQTVNNSCAQGTGASQEHFRNVVISNTSGAVGFPGTYYATGTVTVNAGATASSSGTWHLNAGMLVNNGTYSVTNTTFHGTASTTTLPAFTLPNLVLDGAHNFELPASGFGVSGTLTLQNSAALDVLGNSSTLGALNMQSASKLRMKNPAGTLTVNGTATMNSLAVWGDSLLTAGTLHIKGTWSPGCNNYVFNASGTHTVNFSGGAAQTVNSSCTQGTGTSQEHFRNVVVSNTGGAVNFPGTYYATGTVSVSPGATMSGGGTVHMDAGMLTNGGTYSISNTTIHGTGTTTTLPAFTFPALELDGAHKFDIPAGGFGVGGALVVKNGAVLDVTSGTAAVGSLTMNTSSRLRMTDPAGVLTVNGSVAFSAVGVAYRDTSLTAGTLRFSGSFATGCGSEVFNAKGTHIVESFGTGNVNLSQCSTADTTATGFHLNEFRVNRTSGTMSASTFDMMGKFRVLGGTASVTSMTAWDSVEVTGGTLTGNSITLRKAGQLLPPMSVTNLTIKGNAFIGAGANVNSNVVVDNAQLEVIGAATIGGTFTTQNSGTLKMVTANTLTVNGNSFFNGGSTAGLLTDGRLELKGNFTQGTNNQSFAADNTHRTAFIGTAAQSIFFTTGHAGAALSRFGELELANVSAGAVTVQNVTVAKSNLVVPASAGDTVRLNQSGTSSTLTVGGVNVSNAGSTRLKLTQVPLTITSSSGLGSITQFDGVRFGVYSNAVDQLTVAWTPAGIFTFNGLRFDTAPNGTSGHYVVMNSGISTSLTLAGATPGGVTAPLSQLISGAALNWP
jgi:hypothetical protein